MEVREGGAMLQGVIPVLGVSYSRAAEEFYCNKLVFAQGLDSE